jgi:chromosome segregation ATPase/ribosomal protein S15P/S13E
MSFATNGMKKTRGERSTPAPLAPQTSAPGFSNTGVIDYRPGLNFNNMLAAKQTDSFSVTKQYHVNLDEQGHTINMQLQPKTQTTLLNSNQPVFLSTDQIAEVASRIASEMNGKSLSEPAASVPAEDLSPHLASQLAAMQERIDQLQSHLKFDVPPGVSTVAVPLTASAEAMSPVQSMEKGLRHHAVVLRSTQDKLDALESDMTQLMATAAEHAECLAEMDTGLRNQKSEIENAHGHIRDHDARIEVSQEQLLELSADVDHRLEERKVFEKRCKASVASLRSDIDASSSATAKLKSKYATMTEGLHNHKEELRSMRSNQTSNSQMQSQAEQRMTEISAGLENHRQEIRMLKSDFSSAAHNPAILAKLERLEAGLEDQSSAMRTMRTQMLVSAQSGNNSTLTHLQALDTSMEQHKGEMRTLRSALMNVPSEANVAAISAGLQNHKTEIRSMRSSLTSNEKDLSSLHTASQPVTAQLLAMQARLDSMQNAMLAQAPQMRATPNLCRTDLNAFMERRPVH